MGWSTGNEHVPGGHKFVSWIPSAANVQCPHSWEIPQLWPSESQMCALWCIPGVCLSIPVKDMSAPNYGHMDFPAKHPNSGQLVTPDKVIWAAQLRTGGTAASSCWLPPPPKGTNNSLKRHLLSKWKSKTFPQPKHRLSCFCTSLRASPESWPPLLCEVPMPLSTQL